MRTLTRVTLSAIFLYGSVALGAFALSEPAYPQGSEQANAEPDVTPEAKPFCGMYMASLVGLPGWRILDGDKLQAYLSTLFVNVPNGDAMAYMVRGDKVALVLGRDGCVVARQIIPERTHRNVVNKALGIVA